MIIKLCECGYKFKGNVFLDEGRHYIKCPFCSREYEEKPVNVEFRKTMKEIEFEKFDERN